MKENEKSNNSIMKTNGHQRLFYGLILAVYLIATFSLSFIARSRGMISIANNNIPIASFTGVFSSLANILLVILVVYFKKRGFITSLILLIIQFPQIIMGMVVQHSAASLPGIFTDLFTLIAIIAIYRRNKEIEGLQEDEVKHLREQQRYSQHLFEQTATALVNAVDAKDEYSHGHSIRVAAYSRMIAKRMGKSDEECYRIYYAALLHDVGKIGISDGIINKKGKLTEEEYDIIKQHPIFGNKILSSVREYPYLSIGAHYHHERYDGKGYPDGLKGEDIPEIARIISVADAYDAMTSNRSYREAIPQQLVREEIIKGSGTQFDPVIAKIMRTLIDEDTEYKMKERDAIAELGGRYELDCDDYRSEISDGILITPCMTRIHLKFLSRAESHSKVKLPKLILFDSLDERVHEDEDMIRDLNYFEYCEIRFDGEVINRGVRDVLVNVSEKGNSERSGKNHEKEIDYAIEAVRIKDHVLIKIDNGSEIVEITIALPDSSRYSYIGLTGADCLISDVSISKDEEPVGDDHITRIADEISYISGPSGDIPNVQIDGYRTAASVGVPISDGLKITFRSMSLPTARLVWHCPYIDIFYSADKRVGGKDFREYCLVRFDGENWDGVDISDCKMLVSNDGFVGWEAWKKANKEGLDFTVTFRRKGNEIITTTENLGLSVKNITTIKDGNEKIYAAITGDQCAITDIHILYS